MRNINDRLPWQQAFYLNRLNGADWHTDVDAGDPPVFDRGTFAPVNPEIRTGLGAVNTTLPSRYRTADDRRQARRIVTGQTFGDPKPCRAGKAPDCEESLRRERSDEAYRLLGKEPPANGYAYLDLDTTVERLDRLRPRRYRPGSSEQ